MRTLKISGKGKAEGDLYDEVAISGSGKVTGDLEATTVKISGSARFDGNVRAGAFEASGSFQVARDLDARQLRCSGAGRVGGSARVETLDACGRLEVDGSVKARDARISGVTKCGGDLEAERLHLSGEFDADGRVCGDEVEIALAGDSRASEIRGAKIIALRTSWGRRLLDFGRRRSTLLAVETIEGEDVHLEATRAGVVKGRRVKIGSGCRIGSVEYGESLQIDPQAIVVRYSGSGPAHAAAPVAFRPVGLPEGWTSPAAKPTAACYGASPAPSDEAGWRMERPLGAETFLRGLQVQFGGREIRRPVTKVAAIAVAFLVAAVVLALVLFVVLPAIGLVVSLVIAGVIVALIVAAIGVPVSLAGLLAVKLALVPIRWFMRRLENRPARPLL